MQLNLNPEQGSRGWGGGGGDGCAIWGSQATQVLSSTFRRFGATQTSAGSSRGGMENGGRERRQGAESDEEDYDNHQRTASDPGRARRQPPGLPPKVDELSGVWLAGPGWTANFRECREAAGPQNLAEWDAPGGGAQTQESGWANFTQFQPFSGSEEEETAGFVY